MSDMSSTPETSTASDASRSDSSPSRSPSHWPGAVVQLAAIAAITVGWALGRFPPEAPWWSPPLAIALASDPIAVGRMIGRLRGSGK